MNVQKFASEVAYSEGLKVQTSIGNIREIMKIIFIKLAKLPEEEILKTIAKYKKKRK